MKAQEKAKELFNKYCYAIRTEETDSGYFSNVIYAKDCALICLDEILNSVPTSWTGFEYECNLDYWLKVKEELEQL